MGAVDAVAALVAVGGATFAVLRETERYGRPPAPATPEPPVVAPAPERAPAPAVQEGVREPLVVEPVLPEPFHVPEPAPTSILSGLAALEHDEHTALRRVGSALVLLALTLLAAGIVGGGIYRLVSGLK